MASHPAEFRSSIVIGIILYLCSCSHYSLLRYPLTEAFAVSQPRTGTPARSKVRLHAIDQPTSVDPRSTRVAGDVRRDGKWIAPAAQLDVHDEVDRKTVMAVFPLRKIAWPGSTVKLKIALPAHVSLYEHLLQTGKRRLVSTLSCLPSDSKTGAATDRRIWSIGTILHLDKLTPTAEETGGAVKYIAEHTVVGRVRIRRLLNPSVLFSHTGEYLQAEVEELEQIDVEDDVHVGSHLIEALDDFRSVSSALQEPAVRDKTHVAQRVLQSSSWKLARFWQDWKLSVLAHRERERTERDHARYFMFGETEQLGELQQSSEFWQPLVNMLSVEDVDARRAMILEMVQEEHKISRARKMLKEIVG